MEHLEQTCGQELAASSIVPELFAALFRHVAVNLREHAVWVGSSSADAVPEQRALIGVAQGYDEISTAAQRTADLMRTLPGLPAAPHDPKAWDGDRFAAWMREKVELQRKLARLLVEHAEQSERVLEQMDREERG